MTSQMGEILMYLITTSHLNPYIFKSLQHSRLISYPFIHRPFKLFSYAFQRYFNTF